MGQKKKLRNLWTFENKKQQKELRAADEKYADEISSKCPMCRVPYCEFTPVASFSQAIKAKREVSKKKKDHPAVNDDIAM